MPRSVLIAHYTMMSSEFSDICEMKITPGKGLGQDAYVLKDEKAWCKFIRKNMGCGEFYVQRCTGKGFPLFWRGVVMRDRFMRIKGKISPYLKSTRPFGAWHDLPPKIGEELS